MDMKSVVRAMGLGIVGYFVPRLLAALGVPFDQWANQLATFLKGAPAVVGQETTLMVLGLLSGFCLMLVELWWKPLGQLVPRVRNWRLRQRESMRSGPKIQRRKHRTMTGPIVDAWN